MYSWFDLCLLLLDLERIIKSVSLQLSSQHHKSLLNTKTSSLWSLPSSCSWCGIPSQVSPPFYLKTLPDRHTGWIVCLTDTIAKPGNVRRRSARRRPGRGWGTVSTLGPAARLGDGAACMKQNKTPLGLKKALLEVVKTLYQPSGGWSWPTSVRERSSFL